jgi:hypothetical protein
VESSEVAGSGLVIASGQAPPLLDLVNAAFDGIAVLVQVRIVTDRAAAVRALLLAVGGLVGLLGYDTADAASPRVGTVSAGGVRLIRGDCAGPDARAADRATYLDAFQHRDETRAVSSLSRGEDERQRPAPAFGREVGLGGQSTPGTAQFTRTEPGSAPPP